MSKITPFLWFDAGKAVEAMNFYCSIFKNCKVINSNPHFATFSLEGQEFMALNGGPMYKFNEATSWFVMCEDQTEVDDLWSKLTADGGAESKCGWLKDKYGMSWQIIPKRLNELLQAPDAAQSGRVMQAMLKMSKIIIADLNAAANDISTPAGQ